MKIGRVELTAGGKSLTETKIQRGIFQGDALSLLLLIIAIMPLNYILRKCTAGYKLSKFQEKINHLMYIDDMKLFAKRNEKELEALIHAVRIYSHDIGMEFGIEKRAMIVMKSGKRHLTGIYERLTGTQILNSPWVWYCHNILHMIKVSNQNITWRGTQPRSMSVMIVKCSPDSQHGGSGVILPVFFQVHQRHPK